MSKFSYYNPATKIWSGKPFTPIYNPDGNLGQIILQRLIQEPKKVFQICDDSGIYLTNFEIYRRALKFINYLTHFGLKQGDVVGLSCSNSENLATLMFACFAIGVAVNPVAMDENLVGLMWARTKPKIVFVEAVFAKKIRAALRKNKLGIKIFTMIDKVDGFDFINDILEKNVDVDEFEFPDLPNISATPALLMCSSGTTSLPKTIVKSHRQVIIHHYPNFNNCDVFFNHTHSFWISHMFFLMYCALYGMKYVITTRAMTPELYMDIIDRHKVSATFCSPAFMQTLFRSPKLRQMESMQIVIVGGTTFTAESIAKIKGYFPNASMRGTYGSTEADIIVESGINGIIGSSSGYPFFKTQFKVIDDCGAKLGPNQLGEFCVKMAVPFSSYLGDSDSYASAFDTDGFMFSGDYGNFDENGQINIIDRIKHLLHIKDNKVSPIEIERVINELDGVIKSCVVGVFDGNAGSDVTYAFVMKEAGKTELTEEFVMNFVNKKVESLKKITGGVYFLDAIPSTPSGKILNLELKKMATEIHGKRMQHAA